jgi:hypothetical protein
LTGDCFAGVLIALTVGMVKPTPSGRRAEPKRGEFFSSPARLVAKRVSHAIVLSD